MPSWRSKDGRQIDRGDRRLGTHHFVRCYGGTNQANAEVNQADLGRQRRRAYPIEVAITLFIRRCVFFSSSLNTGKSCARK